MPDVFISYSRRDSEFVGRLADALEQRGKDVWVDVEGIRDAEVFPAALRSAVEASDGFVFVISPDSVDSPFCEQEVAHAVETGKRIVPLELHKVPDERIPEPIRVRNWIPAGSEGAFDAGVERLVAALDSDLEHTKAHTAWELKALEWDGLNRDRSFLLRGSELSSAETWLAAAQGKEPAPTSLQSEYVLASRQAAARRQRRIATVSAAVALVSIALLLFALIQRGQARTAQTTNKSRALAFESESQTSVDPERALLIATEALKTRPTSDARFAVRAALDADALRARLPKVGDQHCENSIGPAVAYDPTRPRLLEGLCDGTVNVIDTKTRKRVRQLHLGTTVTDLRYSQDGDFVAIAAEDEVVLLHGGGFHPARTIRTPGHVVDSVDFSADGTRIAATSNDGSTRSWISAWETGGGRRIMNYASPSDNGFYSAQGIGFLRGGKRLVAGTLGGARVFDVARGRPVKNLAGTEGTLRIAVSGDDRRLVTLAFPFVGARALTGIATVWDTSDLDHGTTIATFPGVEVAEADFNADGSKLAMGFADGTAGLWATQTRKQIGSFLGPTEFIGGITFAPGGRDVAVGAGDGSLRIWRAGGAEQAYYVGDFKVAGLPPALANGVLTLPRDPNLVERWSVKGFRKLPTLETAPASAESTAPHVTDDGRLAAASLNDGRVVLWDVPNRRRLRTIKEKNYAVAAIGRGGRVATIPWGGVAHVFGRPGEKPVSLRTRHPGCWRDWRVAEFSPDGNFLTGGKFCGEVSLWDVRARREVARTTIAGQVASLGIAPDDRTVAIGSSDSTITLWDRVTGTKTVLAGHSRGVPETSFSRDGRLLVSSSLDATVRIWDVRTHKVLRLLHVDGPVAVRFSADGRHLVTAERDGVFRIFGVCPLCGNTEALLGAAERTVTRNLTSAERQTYLSGF